MTGVLLALVAMVGWGIGDFFIQRTIRKIGTVKTLMYIGLSGLVLLLPLAWNDIVPAFQSVSNVALLLLLLAIAMFAALFNFEGFRLGKIAVIAPILGLELPIVVALSMVFRGERPGGLQGLLIAAIFIGLVLVISSQPLRDYLRNHGRLEKGAVWAGLGAVGLALSTFLTGVASQDISPSVTVWFVHGAVGVVSALILAAQGKLKGVRHDFKAFGPLIGIMALLDNIAWISFAFAATLIPISIATAISESYIALSAILGVRYNREKLIHHQGVGIIIVASAVIVLSYLTA